MSTSIKLLAFLCCLVPASAYAQQTIDKSSTFRSYLVEAMQSAGFSDTEIGFRALITPPDFREKVLDQDSPHSSYSPIDLYKLGKQNPAVINKDLPIKNEKPTILVIFPGIASDIIDAFVFESVIANSQKKITLDLPENQKDRVGLTKYTTHNGSQPFYLIDLRSPFLKMESFLPPEKLGAIFRESMEAVFSAAGFNNSDENVYFLGYSRGVLAALSLINEAENSEKAPKWYETKSGKKRLKGLISLSGSLNGSFADSLYEKDELLVKTGEFLSEKFDALDPSIEAFDDNYDILLGSSGQFEESVISSILTLLGELQTVMSIDTNISLNFGYTNSAVVRFPKLTDGRIKAETGGRRLDRFVSENINDLWGLAEKLTQNLIIIDNIGDKNTCNIDCQEKYKSAIGSLQSMKHIIPGLILMQKERLRDFWAELKLPNDIKYFSLSATMPSAIEDVNEADLPEYRSAYDSLKNNIDNLLLRLSFYSSYDNIYQSLNDGQISASQGMFRHDLLSLGTNKSYELVDLGIVGASHWEVALNPVFITPKAWHKDKKTPLFHAALLRAIANVIAADQQVTE